MGRADPLGNPDDMSPRAIAALAQADVVFAEDTRRGKRLLQGLGLQKPLRSCFDGNESARAQEVAQVLGQGQTAALISDAGTPGISDPGYRVIQAALAASARITVLPGPAAFVVALVGSGLPTDKFVFLGFPPQTGAFEKFFAPYAALPATLIFYESPTGSGPR